MRKTPLHLTLKQTQALENMGVKVSDYSEKDLTAFFAWTDRGVEPKVLSNGVSELLLAFKSVDVVINMIASQFFGDDWPGGLCLVRDGYNDFWLTEISRRTGAKFPRKRMWEWKQAHFASFGKCPYCPMDKSRYLVRKEVLPLTVTGSEREE